MRKPFVRWKKMTAICLKEVKDVKVALREAETKASVKTFVEVNIMNFEVPLCRPA